VLGSASAALFAREGARIAAVDAVEDTVRATVEAIEADGGEAMALVANVREADEVRWAVEKTVHQWGTMDVLFNNAGIMPHADESFLDLDRELWTTIYETNLCGTAFCSKYVVPHIIANGGGAVVNMGSFLEFMGCTTAQDAYAASKGLLPPSHVRWQSSWGDMGFMSMHYARVPSKLRMCVNFSRRRITLDPPRTHSHGALRSSG
jgi:NAD(P)-dependent dehydrogenase (short-subunit alcohol dehydrogenase family)